MGKRGGGGMANSAATIRWKRKLERRKSVRSAYVFSPHACLLISHLKKRVFSADDDLDDDEE